MTLRRTTFGLGTLLLAVLVAAGGTTAHAQRQNPSLSLAPDKAITQYVHNVWTKKDGLPQNAIGAIAQTHDGYLWIGTQEGVARFDGVQFTAYNKHNTDALADNFITRELYEDDRHRLWIGTEGRGLYAFKEGTFTHYAEDEGLTGQSVSSILQDRKGRVWVGTYDAGLFVLDDSVFVEHPANDALSSRFVSTLYEDRAGALWIGTDQGVHVLRGERSDVTTYGTGDGLPHPFVTAVREDQAGRVWVGTREGLSRKEEEGWRPVEEEHGPAESMIFALEEDADGSLWVGTDYQGLYRYHDDRFEQFNREQGLSHNRVTALHVDREGSLWIGTEAGGLNQLYNGKFTAYGTREGLSSDMALTVYEADDASLWVGTEGGGVNRVQDGDVMRITRQEGLSSDIAISLQGGRDGAIWVGTYGGGLNRLDGASITQYTKRDGLPSNNIFALHRREDGPLWVGTDAGIVQIQGTSVRAITSDDELAGNSVSAVLEDREGMLWIGTYDRGLIRYDGQRFEPVADQERLGANRVIALHEDAAGVLWIGTYGGGLVRLKEGSFTRYATDEGLPDDRIYQILEDDNGYLWMGSNRGVFRVAKDELDAVAQGVAASVTPTVYRSATGALGEVNGGVQPAGWKGHDGRLWFPTDRGATAIDPAAVPSNTVPPSVVIEQVRVDEQPAVGTETVHVAPGTETIEIQFAAPSFVAPEQMRFRYKLEGFNREWHETSARRPATYTNLDPGTYTFRLRAANGDGVWSETDATVTVIQQPHFYQTSWFYLLCIVTLVGTVYGGYRMRVRQMTARRRALERQVEQRTEDLRIEKEKTEQALEETEKARQETEEAKAIIEAQAEQLQELDRIKTRFFNNLSHEFRTPLTLTIGPLENALTGLHGEVEGVLRERLGVALQNARRLLRLINQILNFSKIDSGEIALHARRRDLVHFVEGIVLSFSAFAQEQDIDLRFEGPEEQIEVYYDPEKMERVLFNLLSNAIKFTPEGGQIEVALAERTEEEGDDEGWVEISVEDSGPGIPEEQQPYIFDRFRQVDGTVSSVQEGTGIGLALVKELVELHDGTVRVESMGDEGSMFVVALRKGRRHLNEEQIAVGDPHELAGDQIPPGDRLVEMIPGDVEDDKPAIAADGERDEDGVDADRSVILVVDDNPDLRDYVRSCLQPQYQVIEAREGEEGLEHARATRPDLILSDVMMPGMDGRAFCRAVKADEALDHIPFIMLTAKASTDMKVEGLNLGADDYMAKPFNAEELLARVRNLLTLREQERELKELNEHLEQKVDEQLRTILQEREKYEARLRTEKQRAEAAARMKSAILNNMSHEFRTPMTNILGYAEILEEEAEGPTEEFAQYILRNSERLMNTLNDVLELADLEAAANRPATGDVDVRTVVDAVVDAHASTAEKKGIRLRRPASDDALRAPFDEAALDRVIGILVDNAVKFTEEGTVTVETGRSDAGVFVRVEDTGIGISEAFMPKLFEPFHQESMGDDRAYEGKGLSLSIAKRLVDTLGGEIEVESEKGKGTRFTVFLPDKSDQS